MFNIILIDTSAEGIHVYFGMLVSATSILMMK